MQLTPWMLASMTLLVMLVVPALTLVISAWLLSRYRRAVSRLMQQRAAEPVDVKPPTDAMPGPAAASSIPSAAPAPAPTNDPRLGPNRLLLRYFIAGGTLAIVFAGAAWFVYPHQLGLTGFLLAFWIYIWPVVVAAWLVLPVDWTRRIALVALYAIIFAALIAVAQTIKDIPAIQSGTISLPARSSATPQIMLRLWFFVSGVPTLLAMLCFNRWARSVAPLVLAFVTLLTIGLLSAYLAVFSPRGVDLTVAAAVALNVHVFWLLGAMLLLTIALGTALAWSMLRWFGRASRQRTVSAQSLMLDALWLLYASFFGMWLVLGGVAWIAVVPVGFVVYRLALTGLQRRQAGAVSPGRGLSFLRVFALGRRGERLVERLYRYWRHLGSLQLIAGPDTARSTVQPHEFLDFVGGKLSAHFVHDAASLERSVAGAVRRAGADGLFRINSFFCRDDSWQLVLPRLFEPGETVLMDLRGFSQANAGCIHEIEYLVATVPIRDCLFLIDDTTDHDFLELTLDRAWDGIGAASPNRTADRNDIPLHRFASDAKADRLLVRRLYA